MATAAVNSFELITKYLPKAVDKYFAEDAKTAILEQGSKFIDVKFDQTGYVKIASMLMDGLSDYYQAQGGTYNSAYADFAGNTGTGNRDGFALGNVSVEWEIFRLQWCRGKQFKIDYIADEETAGVVIGNAIEEFNRLKVIPEVDAARFSIIADTCSASLGNLVNQAPGANDIITDFNAAFEWLAEHEAPEEEQVIFVNPTIMTYIRNSSELTKFLTQGDYKSAAGLDFTVEKYAGRPIITVPSNRFFTNVLIAANGYRAQADSKRINYMVVSKKAVVPVRKLEWNKIYGPEMSGLIGFHGYVIDYLLYHGVVIPKNKIVGCYTSYNNSEAGASYNSTLAIDVRYGTTANHWSAKNYFTNPAGLRGYLVYVEYNASASEGSYAKEGFTLGQTITGTEGTAYKLLNLGEDQTASGAGKKAYFGLVDSTGKFIAVSGQIDVSAA